MNAPSRPLQRHRADETTSRQVSAAFDAVAARFDTTLENEITRGLRTKIYSVVSSYVRPGAAILDMNCGTGIDLEHFIKAGYRATGVDLSPAMIAAARSRLESSDKQGPRFYHISFEDLSAVPQKDFDLVFSNFGGMNCVRDLEQTARSIAGVLKPGAYFIGVLMPPFSIWESASFAARFRWSDAVRRFRAHTPATGFDDKTFPVFYHSPKTVVKEFSKDFILKRIVGLSIFSPTPQSTSFVRRHPRLWKVLGRLDSLVERIPLIRSIGDHYLIVLEKRG
ncbi:MAG TPA: class I SAM-dependent methyltransferase [Bacteroidota bacterium]|nr:class I SAM-dependent methyltransferase [Bacteroidota bacterium]